MLYLKNLINGIDKGLVIYYIQRMTDRQPPLTDISGMLAMLPEDKQKLYINTLYAVARTAVEARCGELRVMDLEILQSLEDESDARFEDWISR